MPELFYAKAFYFFFYAAGASLIPFLAVFYQSLGLRGSQIGFLAAISPLMMLISTPIWGGIADSTQQHKRILLTAVGGALLSISVLSQIQHFYTFIPVVIVFAMFSSPIIPLVDNSVMALLRDDRASYGKQRMFGAVGWGIAGPVIGLLADQYGLQWPFWGYLAMLGSGFLVLLKLPVEPVKKTVSIRRGLIKLMKDYKWVFFLVMVYISGTSMSVITNFLFLYLGQLGAGPSTMGLALAVATISEVPVLFYSGKLISRFGAQGVLLLSLSTSIIRSLGYAFLPVPAAALSFQLLHGLTFSAMWAAGVSYASENAPPGLGATTQSVFFSVVFGLSSISGAILGGILFENFGGIEMFKWNGFMLLVSTLIFFVGERFVRGSGRSTIQ